MYVRIAKTSLTIVFVVFVGAGIGFPAPNQHIREFPRFRRGLDDNS